MTFKHIKFQDSVVMRSLEKVAKEKGLIKEEDLVKKASKSIDLSPTPVLLVNLLKLAAGLRDKGYDDAAVELENKAIAYKQAQTLYETSKEKGEDIIDAAHPKGSHKLEGVEGDALFETILDQHLADLQVVEKKPTGKLASSKDILKAVRVVLAQEAPAPVAPAAAETESKDQLLKKVRAELNKVISSVTKIDSLTEDELNFGLSGYLAHIQESAANPTEDNIKYIQKLLIKLKSRLKPGVVFGLSSSETWTRVQPLLQIAINASNNAYDLRIRYTLIDVEIDAEKISKPYESAPGETLAGGRQGQTTVMNANGKQFMNGVNGSLSQLKAWTIAVNGDPDNDQKDKDQAMRWINDRTTELTELRSDFMNQQDPNVQNQEASGYVTALSKSRYARENAEFKKVWIG